MHKIKGMIVTVLVAGAVAITAGCNSDKNAAAEGSNTVAAVNSAEAPILMLKERSHDFGSIKAGEKVEYSFEFTNTGKTPLQIVNAVASCGCTVPEYPTRPVMPGEKGNMLVRFDSTDKTGLQDKAVTIYSNAKTEELHILANVK